jgi:hypothetical protein
MDDAKRRNRLATGERHGRHKLTAAKVREIRAAYVPRSTTLHQLARRYGVDHTVIHKIVRWQLWKSVA